MSLRLSKYMDSWTYHKYEKDNFIKEFERTLNEYMNAWNEWN